MQAQMQTLKQWMIRAGAVAVLALALVAGLALSALFFAFFLVIALVGAVVVWWQGRGQRTRQPSSSSSKGQIIEVEYHVVDSDRERNPQHKE